MHVLYADKDDQYRIQLTTHVPYLRRHRLLHMDFLSMKSPLPGKRYPAVLYIPGSGWMSQDLHGRIPELVEVARCGYLVANMEYRHTEEGQRFPAQVEDAKSAIRFLRAHADELNLDPDRIAIWGDSSGGHTALLAGLSDPDTFITQDNYGLSASVRCIVNYYAPTDFLDAALQPSGIDHTTEHSIEGKLLGAPPANVPELSQKANPLTYISEDRPVPPVLTIHGDRDDLIPFRQSVILHEKLRSCGYSSDFYMVRNGGHGFGTWNREVLQVTKAFLQAHL
ncbi:MAG: alpha/beta hydrolase [Pseudoflavonifractor sp.]|nr:alpha/beta hydrolase [Pseudoflavonifractor sp.]